MSTKASKRPARESSRAASRIVPGKKIGSVEAKTQTQEKARTEEDWLKQERAERPLKNKTADVFDQVIGRESYRISANNDDWKDLVTGKLFSVSRLYWHESPFAIALDLPGTDEEMKAKEAFFAKTKFIYLAVAPGESISPENLGKRLDELNLAKAKQFKVLQPA